MLVFLQELKLFSKQNWRIFILLIFALYIVLYTWKGNIIEIIILFLLNFLWNLFIMIMQNNYNLNKNIIWSIYQIFSNIIFISIWIYWIINFWEFQYMFWQITYTLAAIKVFYFYYYKKELFILNEKNFILLNSIIFIFFLLLIKYEIFSILQWVGFSLVTTWLVSIKDKIRYWLNLIWIFFIVIWSLVWVYSSYIIWNINWISLWYLILTSTVFIFYIKLIKKYV